jgi:putative glutamine amidotransferase
MNFRSENHGSCHRIALKGIGLILSVALLMPLLAIAQGQQLTIAVSKLSKNYDHWLRRTDSTIRIVDMYTLTPVNAARLLESADGLLLTGGEDVFPGWYGKLNDTVRCTEMNLRRDTLDMALINKALELKLPIMAVCRGHQILNVTLGGTLIVDIPSDITEPRIHQCDDYLHCFHDVQVIGGTILARNTGATFHEVTTNHHQAVEKLSPRLRASAFSADHLIEAIEWFDPANKPFLIGVQWHPERMSEDNPLSGRLACSFLENCRLYYQNRKP